jgi:lipoprotein-releasing system permease protein
MIRPLEVFVGLRYTRAKRRNHFISFISATSMLGITVGVWALITVLSVMNGFGEEIRSRLLEVAAHATITSAGERLSDWREVVAQARENPQVVGAAPFILGQGMLAHGGAVSGALIRGVAPADEATVADITPKMVAGGLDGLEAGEFGILVGDELSWTLNLQIGSKVTLIAPQGQATPAGLLPRLKRFTVVGIFDLGLYEYDSGLAFVHIADAATLYRFGDSVTGVRLSLDDVYRAPLVSRQLQRALGDGVRIRDWTQENANYFRALRIEKTVMFIILSLIVVVAAFNIVSTLVMVVTDKQSDIAILRTLGMSPRSVMAVFMVQGTVIGIVGTLLGGVLGVLTALNVETLVPAIESLIGTKILAPEVYYISEVPSEMRWPDVIVVTCASMLMGLFATLYPAWRASRTQPAEALRYE